MEVSLLPACFFYTEFLASRPVATQPEGPCTLGPHAAPHHPLAASAYRLSSLSPAPHGRPHL